MQNDKQRQRKANYRKQEAYKRMQKDRVKNHYVSRISFLLFLFLFAVTKNIGITLLVFFPFVFLLNSFIKNNNSSKNRNAQTSRAKQVETSRVSEADSLESTKYEQRTAIKETTLNNSKEYKKEEQRVVTHPLIKEIKDYLDKIRKANDSILNEAFTAKIHLLENKIELIIKSLELDQNDIPKVQKFVNYYLPTTVKMLNSYSNKEMMNLKSAEVATLKESIEQTIDEVSIACDKLLEKIFSDDVLDISTDIEALKTMLKRDGLTEEKGLW